MLGFCRVINLLTERESNWSRVCYRDSNWLVVDFSSQLLKKVELEFTPHVVMFLFDLVSKHFGFYLDLHLALSACKKKCKQTVYMSLSSPLVGRKSIFL